MKNSEEKIPRKEYMHRLNRRYYLTNKPELKQKKKAHYNKNSKRIIERVLAYYHRNRDMINAKRRKKK